MMNSGTIVACIESFYSSLRLVIVVDVAHPLGKYSSVILTVAAYDGNHQLFLLAFTIVEASDKIVGHGFLRIFK